MGDQIRIPRVVINSLFFFPPSLFEAILKPVELQHCVMPFLLHVFIIYLLVISPCPYLPEFIYNITAKTLTSNTHLGIPGFVSSPPQSLNKSESSNYTANGDLAIKSVFVKIVSSAILNSQAGYRCTLVLRLPFPVPRSPLPVLATSELSGEVSKKFIGKFNF